MMKTLAILCLVVLLPCVWSKSLQKTGEDEFDLRQLSKEDLVQFVNDASRVLKRTVDELQSLSGSSISKRFLDYDLGNGFGLSSNGLSYKNNGHKFNLNHNGASYETPRGHKFGYNNDKGLTYNKGNFGAHIKPTNDGFQFGFHHKW